MEFQDNTPLTASDSPDVQATAENGTQQPEQVETVEVKTPSEPRRWCVLAICSIIITVIGWIAANGSGYVAIGACVVAIILGAIALKSHRHAVRNTAITSIIAAAVLLVVLAAFMIVIYLGLKSL